MQDPEYRRKIEEESSSIDVELKPGAQKSVLLFLVGALAVVVMGAFPSLRPQFESGPMGMAHTIEIIMLSVACPDGSAL